MEKNSKIYVAGHNGLVGSAIVRELKRQGYSNIVFRSSQELDLRNQQDVEQFFKKENPDYVFLAAATVGGIKANMEKPAEFIYNNIQIQNNVIHCAYKNGVKRLVFLSSNCVYPKEAEQPFKEECLLQGPPEQTNEPYAIAKIAGMKLCEAYSKQYGVKFISVMPASLFGPNDNFDILNSHFVPALLRKFHEAKTNNKDSVELWGTGKPRREIMHVDNAARACIFLINNYNGNEPVNIGVGYDYSIVEIANTVAKIVGFEGRLTFDTAKPDGVMRKLLDSDKITKLGWKAEVSLEDGLRSTYQWFIENPTSL